MEGVVSLLPKIECVLGRMFEFVILLDTRDNCIYF